MIVLNRANRSWQRKDRWPFWPAPIEPGSYMLDSTSPDAPLVAYSNNHRDVLELLENDLRVLAIPTGGLPLNVAIAFGSVELQGIAELLSADRPSRVVIPQPLFAMIQRHLGPALASTDIVAGPVEPAKLAVFAHDDEARLGAPQASHASQVLIRLRWAVTLGIGQTLLLSIPLILYGIPSWLLGLAVFWSALLWLAFLWPLVPFQAGWLKGVCAGGVLALLVIGFGRLGSGDLIWPSSYAAPLGITLSGIWAGLILPGAK